MLKFVTDLGDYFQNYDRGNVTWIHRKNVCDICALFFLYLILFAKSSAKIME